MTEPHLFQYEYIGDGNPTGVSGVGRNYRFLARGDLDCDGTFVTYTLDGDSVGDNPSSVLVAPTTAD